MNSLSFSVYGKPILSYNDFNQPSNRSWCGHMHPKIP